MKSKLAATIVCLWLQTVAYAASEATPALMQTGRASFQAGDYMTAIDAFVRILQEDPGNKQAQRQLWLAVQAIQNVEKARRTEPPTKERQQAVDLARRDLELRRQRVGEILKDLDQAYKKSADFRSPEDLFAAMEVGARFLRQQPELEEGLVRFQGELYFAKIRDNLKRALTENRFASKKDLYNAQGYLEYFQKDLKSAAAQWRLALGEDPKDPVIAENYSQLQKLIAAREKAQQLRDLWTQGNVYLNTGYLEQASDAFQALLRLDPVYPGAQENLNKTREAIGRRDQEQQIKRELDHGLEEFNKGRLLDAAQTWLEALQIDPLNSKAKRLLAMVNERLSESKMPREKEQPHPSKAPAPRATDPDEAQADYSQGIQAYMDGDLNGAISLWRKALDNDPEFTKARRAIERTQAQLQMQ